ncbi:MAG: hypothetical protein ABIZ80_26095, partial [Bryobacteraceae bacterium]
RHDIFRLRFSLDTRHHHAARALVSKRDIGTRTNGMDICPTARSEHRRSRFHTAPAVLHIVDHKTSPALARIDAIPGD